MKEPVRTVVVLSFFFLVASSSMAADRPSDVGKPCLADEPAKVHGNLPNEEIPPYKNVNLSVETRVADLVSRMTLEEKISQMSHLAPAIPHLGVIAYEPIFNNPFEYYSEFDKKDIEKLKRQRPWENRQYWNEGECLDGGWWSEALHGVARAGLATVFPQSIGLGSTWNPALIEEMASAISDEAHVHNIMYGKKLIFWSPTINILRDPRWGRFEESYSEDPYLLGRLAVAFVKGMQDGDEKYLKTVATVKHFVANNSEFNRHTGSSNIPERQLREYYLPAFKAAITEAGCFSVMGAYSALNGVPCCANKWLLTDILRDEWGFRGYVVSDCGAISDIVHGHKYETDPEKGVALAVSAGTDLECETCEQEQFMYDKYLPSAVKKGYITEDVIDKAVTRLFRARFRLGEFDLPKMVRYTSIPVSKLDCPEHRRLALKVARQSIVLLKNENHTLPLDAHAVKSIALIGPNANVAELGGYSGTPSFKVTPLDSIQQKVGQDKVFHEKGCGIKTPIEGGLGRAGKLAARCDAAIVVVGTNLQIANEGLDRRDLKLVGIQEELIRRVYKANPRTIVVLMNGAPLAVNWAQEHVPAIIEVWYPGQSGGTAIADVIFGDYNPGGKLPVTFYKSADKLPPLDDYDITKGRTYWYFRTEPLYAFGHGLSYTEFKYANMTVNKQQFNSAETIKVAVDVENVGDRDGDDVVQLYVRNIASAVTQPIRQLKAFKRVHIKAGDTEKVELPLRADDLAYWDEKQHKWFIEPGEYDLQIAAASDDIRLSKIIKVQ